MVRLHPLVMAVPAQEAAPAVVATTTADVPEWVRELEPDLAMAEVVEA